MTGPVRDQEARDALDDFGVFSDDRTEDMRRAPVAADAPLKNAHHTVKREEVQL